MTRQEADREDLLREATGLVDRLEVCVRGIADPVVIGFRRNSAASLFIGQQEVYQFNAGLGLRRGYWRGELIKAERGRLVSLQRRRTATETILASKPLSEAQTAEYLWRLNQRLSQLKAAFVAADYELLGVVSGTGGSVIQRTQAWLSSIPSDIEIPSSPRANGQ